LLRFGNNCHTVSISLVGFYRYRQEVGVDSSNYSASQHISWLLFRWHSRLSILVKCYTSHAKQLVTTNECLCFLIFDFWTLMALDEIVMRSCHSEFIRDLFMCWQFGISTRRYSFV
jgi:hypothetical protein